VPVITKEDLKAHLRIPADNVLEDDTVLCAKIAAAEQWIATIIGKPFADFEDGVPEPLKEAIRQLAGHLYENREATFDAGTIEALPFGLMTLITPYRERFF
jgi:uncharacterized phage protein (predicted DNA packaging)